MIEISWGIIIVLLIVILYKEYSIRKISRNLKYINRKLRSNDYNHILLHTEDRDIKELLLRINYIIEEYLDVDIRREKGEEDIRRSLSNIAHDLKTPLTVLLGYIEIVNNNNDMDIKERERLLKKIGEKGKAILHIIDEFFILSKLENNEENIELIKVNISEVIKENIISYYETFQKEGLELELNIPKEDLFVRGDRSSIDRVLNNLISNGIKYGNKGGVIGINLYENKSIINIEVWDKGKGINIEDKDKVFDRLYTGDKSRNRNVSGSGLGLSITKALINAMNGTIELNSVENVKTTFKISLKKY